MLENTSWERPTFHPPASDTERFWQKRMGKKKSRFGLKEEPTLQYIFNSRDRTNGGWENICAKIKVI